MTGCYFGTRCPAAVAGASLSMSQKPIALQQRLSGRPGTLWKVRSAGIDDAQHRYLDRFTSGLTVQEGTRTKSVEALFGDFRTFVNGGPGLGRAIYGQFAEAVSRARSILSVDSPIWYRAELGVDERGGTRRKRRDGNARSRESHRLRRPQRRLSRANSTFPV